MDKPKPKISKASVLKPPPAKPKVKPKQKVGRPTKYSLEIIEELCERIATSIDGLHKICKSDSKFPSFTQVFKWLNDEDKKEFADKYARAREAQAELLADEIIAIADDSSNDTLISDSGNEVQNSEWIARSKLRVDTRKWKASKLAPKKFGDKIDLDVTSAGEKLTGFNYIPPTEK